MATLTVGTGVLDGPICLPLKGKPSILPPCIYCTSSNRIRRAGACSRRCIYYTTTENEIQYHTVSTGECRRLIRLRRCSLWEFAEIRFDKFHVSNPLYGYGIEYTVGRGIYYITTKRTVGDDVLGVPPSHIYYTTSKTKKQYHTVSTFYNRYNSL